MATTVKASSSAAAMFSPLRAAVGSRPNLLGGDTAAPGASSAVV
jgi:hypothetical protein